MIEYWQASDHQFPEQGVTFKYKMETDLFALAKAKTHAGSLAVSNDGTQFAVFCADKWGSPFFLFSAHYAPVRLRRMGIAEKKSLLPACRT